MFILRVEDIKGYIVLLSLIKKILLKGLSFLLSMILIERQILLKFILRKKSLNF